MIDVNDISFFPLANGEFMVMIKNLPSGYFVRQMRDGGLRAYDGFTKDEICPEEFARTQSLAAESLRGRIAQYEAKQRAEPA